MSMPWEITLSSSSVEGDFLGLCQDIVYTIEDRVKTGKLLNERQFLDLSSKLSKTIHHIRQLLLRNGLFNVLFRPALQGLYRQVEKANLLMNQCGEEDWCVASVFHGQNESSFREILLDVGMCYSVIFEQVKSRSQGVILEDLRQSSVFLPATVEDVQEDQQELRRRLEGLASEPASSAKLLGYFLREGEARKQGLARYLLAKLSYTSQEFPRIPRCNAILWEKESEPSGTWGNSSFLGAGSGASGVCKTQWLGVPCARKEFHGQELEAVFKKEASILAHLKHPCIVNFICCGNGQKRGDRFIAMELMEKSLSDLIEDQKDAQFSVPVVVDIIVQIARGMCYLHTQGIAHRDLKPQNVVVNRLVSAHLEDYYCVKLVDFGMSKIKVEASKSNTISFRGVGTTRYRAPEVHPKAHPNGKGRASWFKADVYSFAMTCAHILSLKAPFEGMLLSNGFYKELLKGRRPVLPGGCPEELVDLLRDCWGLNPCSRPSFLEICTRLEMLRHKVLRGYFQVDLGLEGEIEEPSKCIEFIKIKLEEFFPTGRLFVDAAKDEMEETYSLPRSARLSDAGVCDEGAMPRSTSHQTSYLTAQDLSLCDGDVVCDGGVEFRCNSDDGKSTEMSFPLFSSRGSL